MAPPPVALFLTTIASAPKLRQRQEYLTRILQVSKIPYTSYDLASNEDAKKLWKRKAPLQHQQLPGILVGNRWPGTFDQFEEAVECGELAQFLRRNEEWDAELDGDGRPALQVQPVGVPGAARPSEMTNQRPSFAPASSAASKPRGPEIDLGDDLAEFGLGGVKVTDDELAALVKELGFGDAEAADFVKGFEGIGGSTSTKIGDAKPTEVVQDTGNPDVAEDKPMQVVENTGGSERAETAEADTKKPAEANESQPPVKPTTTPAEDGADQEKKEE